jgi:Probable cobalt transporter subunit (CbtB)
VQDRHCAATVSGHPPTSPITCLRLEPSSFELKGKAAAVRTRMLFHDPSQFEGWGFLLRKGAEPMAHVWTPTANRRAGPLLVGVVALFMLYLVGLDQGLLLSVFEGPMAFDQNLIHEFVHDARHAAAFPCH